MFASRLAQTRPACRSAMQNTARTQSTQPAISFQRHIVPTLPRLPVPDLRQTLLRYLTSIEPFLHEDEAAGGKPFDESHLEQAEWLKTLPRKANITWKLHDRLRELEKTSPNNWLDDNFWLNKAYLEGRDPILINSNWWLSLQHDDNIPEHILRGLSKPNLSGITMWQVRRAAWLVHRILLFKRKLKLQEVWPDTTRTGIWFRHSVSQIFNVCRVPGDPCDKITPVPADNVPAKHQILVMVRDWFYVIDVYDENGRENTAAVIETKLLAIVADVETRLENGEKAVPVGLLTADRRDTWASNLHHLRSLDKRNIEHMNAIHNTLFALSLDGYTHTLPGLPHSSSEAEPILTPIPDDEARLSPSPQRPSPSTSELKTEFEITPLTTSVQPELSPPHSAAPSQSAAPNPNLVPSLPPPGAPLELDAALHNFRSGRHGHNRFFDKPFTLIVESNTRAGVNGEHSVVDALVPSIVAEFAIVEGVEREAFSLADPEMNGSKPTRKVVGWKRLDWVVDEKVEKACVEAGERAKALVEDSDDSVLWYGDYGADWIKDKSKLSPDAYIQMALQLAWYKNQGYFTAVYETALTRIFKHGRTETIRSFTTESRAFVLGMMDPSTSPIARFRLLQRAVQSHVALTRQAATGQGIDRVLMAMSVMDVHQACQLFKHPLFKRSQEWKLSTSGLSAGHLFRGTGFGAAYHDGYGINYLAGPEIIKFGIESKYSCPKTSTGKFKEDLKDALREMRLACVEGLADLSGVQARL
ncbi:hypothetical protein JAAARDRAFT_35697 [Jaapia argillacea MUCL 33604]|uniref:Choline/carnitine acyltransferase domain-containing protein n=1 Tax=Jaapia argillacea MUCL 33604 TaxID=933084 RepID=A0A067Q0T1_9AGAM|nr:hypothetical protein JAAARDRAFT_35697 [Jaapia argillacea MUCL 33604]